MPATTSGASRPEASTSRADTGATMIHAATVCHHEPACPPPDAADRYRAHVLASHPEQGWSLLCNGVIVFDDLGALLPDHGLLPAQSR